MVGTLRSFTRRILVVAIASAFVPGMTPTAAAQTAEATGAARGGIKVHGDWTIVVRDPDGTIVSRHDFQNALASGGGRLLAQLLAGTAAAGKWLVAIDSTPECHPGAGGFLACTIVESGGGFGAFDSQDLTATIPTSGPNAGKLVLRGSYRAPSAMALTVVGTYLAECAGSTAPASCNSGLVSTGLRFFSSKALGTPVAVVADQIVDVTVVFSFS